MLELRVFVAALDGDDSALRDAVGSSALVAIDAGLSCVLVVENDADGGQRGTLAEVGAGGGLVSVVALPRSFPVTRIGHDGRRFTLTDPTGRAVSGTPQQFQVHPRIIDAEHNPDYERHLTETFLATATLPDRPVEPGSVAPVRDPALGEIRFTESVREYATVDPLPGTEVTLSFDCADRRRVLALLDHARELAGAFDAIRRDGLAFLWAEYGDGTGPADDGFATTVTPSDLVVYRSGDFEVCFEDGRGRYIPEEYWAAVSFRRDRTPVAASIEA